jgi:hypothetical protein
MAMPTIRFTIGFSPFPAVANITQDRSVAGAQQLGVG